MQRPDLYWSIAFSIFAFTLFILTQVMLQNVHITTTNGMWKSMDLQSFIDNPGWQSIDASNALLFPMHALFAWIFDQLGIFESLRWRQMAVTNGIFGAFGAGLCFFFALKWTQSHLSAVLIASAYCFSGSFALHSVINEDIIPSAVLMLWAMLLAGEWFGRPTYRQIFLVAVVFNIGWLIEWRTMFPPLPPMCFALLLSSGTLPQRMQRLAFFLILIPLGAFIFSAGSWLGGHRSFAGALGYAQHLLWTGKGVGSGWGGFTTNKFWILWSGISEAVFGGRYFTNANWMSAPYAASTFIGLALVGVMAILGLAFTWRNRLDPAVRAKFVLFYGLFLAGAVFNAYSQPSDPQMQINIMIVALPGWALIISCIMHYGSRYIHKSGAYVASVALVAIPIWFSHSNFAKKSGYDAVAQAYRAEMEEELDLNRTVFLYHGFDGQITWWVAKYDGRTPEPYKLLPAPSEDPAFKWIDYAREAVQSPDWSGEKHALDVVAKVQRVIDLGYRVVVPAYFLEDEDYWIISFGSISSAQKALSIREILQSKFSTEITLKSKHGSDLLEIKVN